MSKQDLALLIAKQRMDSICMITNFLPIVIWISLDDWHFWIGVTSVWLSFKLAFNLKQPKCLDPLQLPMKTKIANGINWNDYTAIRSTYPCYLPVHQLPLQKVVGWALWWRYKWNRSWSALIYLILKLNIAKSNSSL